MIIKDTPENKVITSGVDSNTEFTIKNSAKAFHILSTSLYANPKLAILRELGCNARDSHVAAGQTRPWELSLPTQTDPTLEIEDFGLGLSNSQVLGMFTTFFESTKTDSNDYVGALGLGSKSPFSYTDNYTIVAVKDGIKNVYSAYKTDDGIPAIARLNTESTTQCDGVKISIAIRTLDRESFISQVVSAYSFFEQKPRIKRGINYIYSQYHELESSMFYGHDIGVAQIKGASRYNSQPSLIMGGIKYPIDAGRPEFTNYRYMLESSGFCLLAAIGSVEMTPSREGLTYSKQTVAWILKELKRVEAKITEVLKKEVSSLESDWYKSEFLLKLRDQFVVGKIASSLSASLFPNDVKFKLSSEFIQNNKIEIRRVTKMSHGKIVINSKCGFDGGFTETLDRLTPISGIIFAFDNSRLRITDIKTGFNYSFVTRPKMIIFSGPAAAKAKLLEKFKEAGIKLEDASKYIKKQVTQKAPKPKNTHSTLEEGSAYKSAAFVIQPEHKTISSNAKFYITTYQNSIQVVNTKYVNETLIWDFVKNNPGAVIGLSKPQLAAAPTHLKNLVDHIESEIEADIELANTESGCMALVLNTAIREQHGQHGSNISIKNIKFDADAHIEDPLLKKVLKYKNVDVKFKHPTIAYTRSLKAKDFGILLARTIRENYSALNACGFDSLDKQTQLDLVNLIYKAKNPSKITSAV